MLNLSGLQETRFKATVATLRHRFLHGMVTGGHSGNEPFSREKEAGESKGSKPWPFPQAQHDTNSEPSTPSSVVRTICKQVPEKQDNPFMLYLGKQVTGIGKEKKGLK